MLIYIKGSEILADIKRERLDRKVDVVIYSASIALSLATVILWSM